MAEHEAALYKKASLTVIPMLQKRKPVKLRYKNQKQFIYLTSSDKSQFWVKVKSSSLSFFKLLLAKNQGVFRLCFVKIILADRPFMLFNGIKLAFTITASLLV